MDEPGSSIKAIAMIWKAKSQSINYAGYSLPQLKVAVNNFSNPAAKYFS
jgi:hypothetical protein